MNHRHNQPRLNILEGGRERHHPGIAETVRRHTLAFGVGVVAALSAVGYAVASQGESSPFDKVHTELIACNDEAQILGTEPTMSEALARQLPNIDSSDWDQISEVPTVAPNGVIQSFGKFGPQGPPIGSEIPTDCKTR